MIIFTIVTILATVGLAFSGPIQNDGVKSASVPVGVKGRDVPVKLGYEDQSGDSKYSHVNYIPAPFQGAWQSYPVNVQPVKVDSVSDAQYVPIIDAKPQLKWFHHDTKRVQSSPSRDVMIEQRREEPISGSSYDSLSPVPVNGDVYDPYKDIMPDVLTGKRRLSEDDVSVAGQPESGSNKNRISVNDIQSAGKVPVRSVIYGDKNVPQHGYTEDSFPSVITVKGRQYVIIPKQIGDKISPFYGPPQYPWPWAFASQHGAHYGSPGFDSFIYHSGPSKFPYSTPAAGYGPGAYGTRQVIHGQSSLGHVPDVQSGYGGWNFHGVHQQYPVASVQGAGSVLTSSVGTGYQQRPAIQSTQSVHADYAPYVHTQYVHRMPAHVNRQQSVYQQSPYYGFPGQVPVTQVAKGPVSVTYSTKPNWAWVLAPQQGGGEGIDANNWLMKGVQSTGIVDAPVIPVTGHDHDTKPVIKTVTIEGDKSKVFQSSPDVKQVAGKSWLIYSPASSPSPWSYGWPQHQWYDRSWYGPSVGVHPVPPPQYSPQWDAVNQWSSPGVDQSWSVKASGTSDAGVAIDNQGVVQSPPVKQQPVQVPTTEKVQNTETVSTVAANSPLIQQTAAVGGAGGVSYALHIDHGTGGQYSYQSLDAAKKS